MHFGSFSDHMQTMAGHFYALIEFQQVKSGGKERIKAHLVRAGLAQVN